MLSKEIYRLNAIPINMPNKIFHIHRIHIEFKIHMELKNSRIHTEPQKSQNSQSYLEKKRTKMEVLYILVSKYITKLQ